MMIVANYRASERHQARLDVRTQLIISVANIPDNSPKKYHFNAVPMALGGFSTCSVCCDTVAAKQLCISSRRSPYSLRRLRIWRS